MSRASEKIIFVDGICNFGKTYWRVNFTQEEKYLIAGTQNFECNICNCDLNDGKFDIDHKHRLGYRNEKGELKGNNQIENLQALCKECHKEKTKTDKI
jgi:5-methylcytosine-specific restriction endonuclease McrA